jgi:predicted heme/steroid binding protein/uncharacterized membrane protein
VTEKEKQEKELTAAELAEGTGEAGRPAYIAYRGRVYDVSDSPLWEGGRHMEAHRAGGDLTAEFAEAPHGEEVFERYPQVGLLSTGAAAPEEEAKPPGKAREFWFRVLKKVPLLRRHPHPMMVHFPIVFMISATAFTLLSLVTGVKSFDVTAFHCLGGAVLFTPVAMATGLFTWWLNFLARPLRPVIIKIVLSPILLAAGAGAFIWRWLDPGILERLGHWTGLAYLALVCVLTPLVTLIGWYGATMTFPLHEE